jgi:hypothetical protein
LPAPLALPAMSVPFHTKNGDHIMARVRVSGGYLNVEAVNPGRPDQGLPPGVDGPVDPGYGIDAGLRPDHGFNPDYPSNALPGAPPYPSQGLPPYVDHTLPLPPDYPDNSLPPIAGHPLPPEPVYPSNGLPIYPPPTEGGTPEHPIVIPPPPPGAIWPPLPKPPEGTPETVIAVVFIQNAGWFYVAIDPDAVWPAQGLPGPQPPTAQPKG